LHSKPTGAAIALIASLSSVRTTASDEPAGIRSIHRYVKLLCSNLTLVVPFSRT